MTRARLLVLAALTPMVASAAEFTTWIAGANQYQISRVATDSGGNTYVAGTRTLAASSDIFVVKLDNAGNILLFREIAGGGSDKVSDMAIDSAGNIYVAGSTTSLYFPIVNAMQTSPGPGFLFKLNADGSQLIWSTYYREAIAGIALDSSGNVYLTGSTTDPKYPVTAGLPAGTVGPHGFYGVTGAFLTRIDATGNHIMYSTVIAGTGTTCSGGSSCLEVPVVTSGVAIAVDAGGDAFMAGNTNANNLATTPGVPVATGTGAFVCAVKADGSALTYLTFVGSAFLDGGPFNGHVGNTASAIAADAAGDVYVTGSTWDTGFPATSGAVQTTWGGSNNGAAFVPPTDAYVLKINPAGTGIVWASYLGGSAADSANSIAVDASNQVWIAGTTASAQFPNAQGWIAGSDFISGFSADGSQLVYSARYPNDGASRSIAADTGGFIHFAGPTGTVSVINPGAAPTPKIFGIANAANGGLDARVSQGQVISIYGPHIGALNPVTATANSTGVLPTQLAGYQVTVGGSPIPLLYVSDSQINAIATQGAGILKITGPSFETPDFSASRVVSRPEIFSSSPSAAVTNVSTGAIVNAAIAVNQDGALNSQSNPAHVGMYEAIWITGSGAALGYEGGLVAVDAYNDGCCSILLGSKQQLVVYAGAAPGASLGVSQVNFQISPGVAITGNEVVPMFLQAGGVDGTLSRMVTLWVAN
jgi:uncharacterized protein (TIGR03437 family)